MHLRLTIVCVFVMSALLSHGQTSRDVAAPTPPPRQYELKTEKKKLFSSKKKKKGVFMKTHEEEVADFRLKMKKTGKEKAKVAKKMDKPQYTDPTYFGHKKPPKRRPVGKRKFCKECGIKH